MPFIVDWLEGHWRGLLEEIWRELTLGNQRRHQRRLRETSRETCHSYRIAWIVQTYKELHRFLLCTDHSYWARWASWVLNKPFISSWLVGIAFSEHLGFERYNIVHAVALVSELWKAHFRIKKMSNVDFFFNFSNVTRMQEIMQVCNCCIWFPKLKWKDPNTYLCIHCIGMKSCGSVNF